MGDSLAPPDVVSGRIHILPAELANQIAAGEVVERPASVVKELVENALDAGARKVEVVLQAGGRRLLRVVDDGCGMTPGEARLALRRHATSKLHAADDLWALSTFGFRGEALPSIAAVSRLKLSTKTAGSVAGFRLLLEGGQEIEARETGMPDGTQIEVRDLFFNTPVRLKFLKAEATESGNVAEALLRLALANPGVHFRLHSEDRSVLDLPPVSLLAERVRSALARRGTGVLHEALGEENGVRVQAFVAAPEEASSTPRNTFLFVNRRSVRDRSLLAALGLAYGELLERGRYPLAVLFVDVPGQELDVNVHPQKLEVRFARAPEVYAAVRHIVGAAIARAPWLVPAARVLRSARCCPRWRGRDRHRGTARHGAGRWKKRAARAAAGRLRFRARRRGTSLGRRRPPVAGSAARSTSSRLRSGRLFQRAQLHRPAAPDLPASAKRRGSSCWWTSTPPTSGSRSSVCAGPTAPGRWPGSGCSFPSKWSWTKRRTPRWIVNPRRACSPGSASRSRVGAGAGWSCGPCPICLKDADPEPLLLDALHGLGEGPHLSAAEAALDHLFATLACHGSKRAGDPMTREGAEALLGALDASDFRSHCPHGRPVLVRFSISELERRFGRT